MIDEQIFMYYLIKSIEIIWFIGYNQPIGFNLKVLRISVGFLPGYPYGEMRQ